MEKWYSVLSCKQKRLPKTDKKISNLRVFANELYSVMCVECVGDHFCLDLT